MLDGLLAGFFGKPPSTADFLIAGLGNPGDEYLDTRHNVGSMVIDRLAALLKVDLTPAGQSALVRMQIDGKQAVLAKPVTYVNTSGPAVKALVDQFNIAPFNVLIVHDDLDLDFCDLRIKDSGGSGGHRGLDSIIAALGTDKFARVRIGIGRPPGRMDPSDFVLSPFSPKEWPEMEVTIAQAAEAALAVIREGAGAAMNRYNKGGK